MDTLPIFYKENGYKKIAFKISKTKHIIINGSINGIKGTFILDTGASNSCIGLEDVNYFNITALESDTTAAGAGAIGMKTKISFNNTLKLSTWHDHNFDIVIFDLAHVNLALINYNVKPVNGIIGADILIKYQAIIDYNSKLLYLKKI